MAAALRAPPADADGGGAGAAPPAVLRALPYFYNSVVDADKTARVLRWSDEYHSALGFAHSLLYVLPRDAAAFEAHLGIRALVEERRLALVLWDQHAGFAEFKVSWRGPGWPSRLLAQVPCRQARLCVRAYSCDCSHT